MHDALEAGQKLGSILAGWQLQLLAGEARVSPELIQALLETQRHLKTLSGCAGVLRGLGAQRHALEAALNAPFDPEWSHSVTQVGRQVIRTLISARMSLPEARRRMSASQSGRELAVIAAWTAATAPAGASRSAWAGDWQRLNPGRFARDVTRARLALGATIKRYWPRRGQYVRPVAPLLLSSDQAGPSGSWHPNWMPRIGQPRRGHRSASTSGPGILSPPPDWSPTVIAARLRKASRHRWSRSEQQLLISLVQAEHDMLSQP